MRSLALILALLMASPALGEDYEHPERPWYLPRYALVGGYYWNNSFSLFGKIGWEVTLLDQRTNFMFVVEGGPGWGVALPAEVENLYQYAIAAGLALKSPRHKYIQWGITVTTGVVFEGAYLPLQGYQENLVQGLVEGRIQVGLQNRYGVAPFIYIGVAQPWYTSFRQTSAQYVGGVEFGFLLDWR